MSTKGYVGDLSLLFCMFWLNLWMIVQLGALLENFVVLFFEITSRLCQIVIYS